jgi:hypothetical protein
VHQRQKIEKLAYYAPHNEKQFRIMDRKEFFTTAGRLLILAGITASAGYLVLNNKVTASCSVSPTCKSCGEFSKCELPQAKEVNRNESN